MKELCEPCLNPSWILQTQIILDSYAKCLGQDLIFRELPIELQAQKLFDAPFVVVSHDTSADPILNYGNRSALELWETDAEIFLEMPSRLTAEPMEREERAEMLRRTAESGFIDDYRGVRISSSGRRFLIERATIWNLVDPQGRPAGQAATFSDWKML